MFVRHQWIPSKYVSLEGLRHKKLIWGETDYVATTSIIYTGASEWSDITCSKPFSVNIEDLMKPNCFVNSSLFCCKTYEKIL